MSKRSPKRIDGAWGGSSLNFFKKREKYATPASVYGKNNNQIPPEKTPEPVYEQPETVEEEPEPEEEPEAEQQYIEEEPAELEEIPEPVEPEPEPEEIVEEKPKKTKKKSKKQMKKIAAEIPKAVEKMYKKADQQKTTIPISYSEATALKHMNIMSCTDMKNYLNETNLSLDQQIQFLKENTKGHRDLRAYIRSQHYGAKDLSFFVQSSNFVRNTLAVKAQEAVASFSPDNSDATDPDCIEMDALLIELEKQKKALKNREDWYNWTKNTGMDALSFMWNGLKSAVSITGSVLYWLGSGIYYIFSTIAQMGFDLWDWITKDPKTAKYVLISLKLLKKRSCRFIGKFIREKNLITKEELATRYRSTIEMARAKPPEDILWDANNEIAQDVFFKATQATVVKSMKDLAEPVGKYLAGSMSLLLGGGAAVATVATGGVAGVAMAAAGAAGSAGAFSKLGEFLGMCTGKIVEVALDETADSMEDAIELGVFIKDQDTCFSLLFELVDPNACLKDMLKEYNQTEFNFKKKEQEAREKEEKKQIEAAREKETPEERKENDKKRAEIQKKKDEEKQKKIQEQVDKEVKKAGYLGGAWLRTKNFFSPQKEIQFDEEEAYDALLKTNDEKKTDGYYLRKSTRKNLPKNISKKSPLKVRLRIKLSRRRNK